MICCSWNTQLMLSIMEAIITMTITQGTETVDTTIIITILGQLQAHFTCVLVIKKCKITQLY